MAEVVEVRVPASTANLGPGFDTVGMALELFNVVRMSTTTTTGGLEITVLGDSRDLPLDWTNLVARSAAVLFEEVGVPVPGLRIHVQQRIPVSRGLGSSAAGIVAGLLAANALAGFPLGDDEVFRLAVEIEGHPDNVAAALFGGFVVSVRGFGSEAAAMGTDGGATGAGLPSVGSIGSVGFVGSAGSGGSGGGALLAARDAATKASAQAGAGTTGTAGTPSGRGCLRYLKLDVPRSLHAVVAIPDFQVPTELARHVLPRNVPMADAVHNIGRTALLVASIALGRLELLADAMEDRLHQPYRADLTPGLTDVLAAARKEGALGAALSGSGPSVLAFASHDPRAVAEAMAAAFAAHGVACRTVITRASSQGATVDKDPRIVAKEQISGRAGAFETR
ncbi:MAG: homoserine kinase [Bacillota bacterium]|nr:homoserine kinase [Bacillota bacterium]